MTDTKISWTTKTWNPTTGCDRVSPGCDHCYAATLAKRLKAMGNRRYQNDGDPKTSGPGFGLTLHPDKIGEPLKWKRPATVFVNSMSDLFHDDVPEAFIAEVFWTMARASQHTFQVLTKRPRRMTYLMPQIWTYLAEKKGHRTPLPNVWLGTSVEDQKRADLRVPLLLSTPAAVRFLSCEPLLGPVDLQVALHERRALQDNGRFGWTRDLHWVIVGGESGPNFRPIDLDWARALRDQCVGHGIPFFYKQGSGRRSEMNKELDGRIWAEMPTRPGVDAVPA